MIRIKFAAVLIASLVFSATARAQSDEIASADDTARFLAGMQVSIDSPLARLAMEPSVQQHANYFDSAFANVEKQQLAKIREWSSANLNAPRPMMYYIFGGPDFLYADAFFPHASTYVLSGLEPVGQIPDLMKLPRGTIAQTLRNIQGSLSSVLTMSYFITAQMSRDLNSGPVNGTLPILYVFLARTGKVIREVSLVNIDERGALQSDNAPGSKSAARGVKIVFTGSDGRTKTLYYFSTNLFDDPGKKSLAFLQFCKQFSQGDSFLKSASYLLHNPSFSQVRNFLLDYSALILQDDTGIPVANFDAGRWQLQPFGRYLTPIAIFQDMYQPRLNELFQRSRSNPIDFGIGYRWRPNESNLLLATRNSGAPDVASPVLKDAVPPRLGFATNGILRKPRFLAHPSRLEDKNETNIY
jgi:hypothetical protein